MTANPNRMISFLKSNLPINRAMHEFALGQGPMAISVLPSPEVDDRLGQEERHMMLIAGKAPGEHRKYAAFLQALCPASHEFVRSRLLELAGKGAIRVKA